MDTQKPHSRPLAAVVLATVTLCLLTVLGLSRTVDGWSGSELTAQQEGSVLMTALRMADTSLSQIDQSGGRMIGGSLGSYDGRVRVTVKLQTYTEPVPCGVRYVGAEQEGLSPYTISAGTPGEKIVTYKVTFHDGIEAAREKVGEEVTRQPIDKVVCRGAGGQVVVDGKAYSYSKVLDMKATAYTTENKSWKLTRSGTVARVGAVAVDPNVIPLGTKLYIVSAKGTWGYGIAVAEDTGVRGNTIDLFLNTRKECIYFGVRSAKVYILEE